jgi:MFS transporter, FHS family, L-fucose permease
MSFAILHPSFAAAMTIMRASFFMSIKFPTIFALGVKGLGRNAKLGALIVMSVAGRAVLPPLLGAIARSSRRLALGYVVVVAAYVMVLGYCLAQGRDVSLQSVERVPEIFQHLENRENWLIMQGGSACRPATE